MRKLLCLMSALAVLGLCSFSSVQNTMAPDCITCLTFDGYSDPGEEYVIGECWAGSHPCGYWIMCGPGTNEICYWYTCHTEIVGCTSRN